MDASKQEIVAAPLVPETSPSQYASFVFPIGVNAPIPVTTTRRLSMKNDYLLPSIY
jgi:hypothetical protein